MTGTYRIKPAAVNKVQIILSLLKRDGLKYTVEVEENKDTVIRASGTPRPRKVTSPRVSIAPPITSLAKCSAALKETEVLLKEHQRTPGFKFQKEAALATEQELLADLEYWQEMITLATDREKKPTRKSAV